MIGPRSISNAYSYNATVQCSHLSLAGARVYPILLASSVHRPILEGEGISFTRVQSSVLVLLMNRIAIHGLSPLRNIISLLLAVLALGLPRFLNFVRMSVADPHAMDLQNP